MREGAREKEKWEKGEEETEGVMGNIADEMERDVE